MTLLDAPKFDEARARRRQTILSISASVVGVLIIAWWLAAARPVDWPWNWNTHLFGRATVNHFLDAVERNDLAAAYGIWMHDKDWQQHPAQHSVYPFNRFEGDWSPNSPDNEYGAIHSHHIEAARVYGNVLLVAILINGRKSDALNLDYDPKTKTLNFSPPGVQLYLGP
ncbi:MAG TPA: hypothetical protein VL991_04185 [Terracidiphilus sp.]|jgi:hypothetical protein|nr:hypothetical protein [Terracidiphilus sp.]